MTLPFRSSRALLGLLALPAAAAGTLTATASAQAAPTPLISTVAGNGTYGTNGDGGPATSAQLAAPTNTAVDGRGDMFIASSGENAIREVTLDGTISIVAGDGTDGYTGDGGPATDAQLGAVSWIAADASGDLFLSDTSHHVIREVAARTGTQYGQAMTAGDIYTVAGTGTYGNSGDHGPATSAEIAEPQGVAVAANGDLFIADPGYDVIREVTSDGTITTVAGDGTDSDGGDGSPATSGQLAAPEGVAVDEHGDLFIADAGDSVIREVPSSTGTQYGQAMTAGDIYRIAGDATTGFSGDGGPATSADLFEPLGLAADAHGDVFIADSLNHRVREVDADTGDITTVAGDGTGGNTGDGDPATDAEISFPYGVTMDATDDLFIADGDSDVIRKVTQVVAPAALSADQTSHDFGQVTDGKTSTATVTVTNTGGQDLAIGTAAVSGTDADPFAIGADTCSTQTVSPGQTCTINVRFAPTAAGAKTAELNIPSDAADSPAVISLSGTGVAASQPTPTPTPRPTPSPKPTPSPQPTPSPKPVAHVTRIGRPGSTQRLLAHGEKVRVYCNQACSLKVALKVYYRAEHRGVQRLRNAHAAHPQPWWRVTVGQRTVKLNHAGSKTVTVRVDRAHRSIVADAGSILLGVYTHTGSTLVRKRWLKVKGPELPAKLDGRHINK